VKNRRRRDRPGVRRPPAPRIDPKGLAAEAALFEEAFDPLLWHRSPL
jgi:hypothetical protein